MTFCHFFPSGAVVTLLFAAIGIALLIASTGEVCNALNKAAPKAFWLSLPCQIGVPTFVVFLILDMLAFASILLSRCEYAYDHVKRSKEFHHRCGHFLATPCTLSVLWAAGTGTFFLQLLLLVLYICVGIVLMVLTIVCRGGPTQIEYTDAFLHGLQNQTRGHVLPVIGKFVSDIEGEVAEIIPNTYCNLYGGKTDVTPYAYAFILAGILGVISQVSVMSSLTAEWERASEELHYRQ